MIFELVLFIITFFIQNSFKKTVFFTLITISVVPLSILFSDNAYPNIPEYLKTIKTNFLIISNTCILLVALLFLVLSKQFEILERYFKFSEIIPEDSFFIPIKLLSGVNYKDSISNQTQDNFNTIFKEIELLMKIKKPWTDPLYSIEELAKDIGTNTTYISQSININSRLNFRNFINNYRLDSFVENMNMNKELAIRDIYINCGFSNQATFNRVFKNRYNQSPQEYFENLQK